MTATAAAVAGGFGFLEAPRWHDHRIWFSDFYTHRVLSAREDGSDLRVEASVPNQPAGLGWLPDGRLLVVPCATARSCAVRLTGRWSATPTWAPAPPDTRTTW